MGEGMPQVALIAAVDLEATSDAPNGVREEIELGQVGRDAGDKGVGRREGVTRQGCAQLRAQQGLNSGCRLSNPLQIRLT